MPVIASQLVAEVSASGIDVAQAEMEAMSAANDAVSVSFAAVEEAAASSGAALASVGEGVSADESGLSEIAASADAAATALASVGEAASADGAGLSETATAMSGVGSDASGTTDILRGLSAILDTLQAGFSDLDASLSEVAANTADTASGISDLSASLSDIAGSAESAAGGIDDAGAAASEAGGGFSDLLGSVGDAATSFGMFVFGAQATVDIAGRIGDAFLGADASMEQTKVAFTTLTGSAQAANDMISQLVNFAATTPFHEEGIDQAAEKMLAFGFNAKDVIPDITAIGDVLSGLGKASDASLNSIIDIFGKIQAAGKLTGGDMMQLTRWGIPAWQLLSKEMGVPIPVLQDMVKKGLVPAKTAIDDLRKGIEDSPLFKGGMAKQAQTFNGLMSTLQDNVKSAWREFTGPLFDQAKGALVQLGNLVSSKGFQQWAKDMGKDVGEGISAVVGFVQNDLIPAFQSISKWIDTNKPTFIAIWNEVLKVLPQVWGALQQVGNFLQTTFQPVWDQLVKTFNEQLKPAWDDFVKALGPAMPALRTIGEIIGGVIVLAIIGFLEFLAKMTTGAIEGFGYVARAVGYLVDKFLWMLTQMKNVVDGVIAIWNGIPAWWDNLVNQAAIWGVNLVNNILSGLKSAWTNVTTWFQNALKWIAGLFPHSPVEHGPLVGFENWGKNIMNGLATSIKAGMPGVQSAFGSLALPGVSGSLAGGGSSLLPGLSSATTTAGGFNGTQTIQVLLDGQMIGQVSGKFTAKQLRVQTGFRGVV